MAHLAQAPDAWKEFLSAANDQHMNGDQLVDVFFRINLIAERIETFAQIGVTCKPSRISVERHYLIDDFPLPRIVILKAGPEMGGRGLWPRAAITPPPKPREIQLARVEAVARAPPAGRRNSLRRSPTSQTRRFLHRSRT